MNLFIFYVTTVVFITINGEMIEFNQTLTVKERSCIFSKFSQDFLWKNCKAVYYLDCVILRQEVIFSVYKSGNDERGTEFHRPGKFEWINLTKYQRVKEFCAYIDNFDKVRQQQTIRILSSCEKVDP